MAEQEYEYKVGDYVEVITPEAYGNNPAGIRGFVALADREGIIELKGPEVAPYVDDYDEEHNASLFLAYPHELILLDPPEPRPTTSKISNLKLEFHPKQHESGNSYLSIHENSNGYVIDALSLTEVKAMIEFLEYHHQNLTNPN